MSQGVTDRLQATLAADESVVSIPSVSTARARALGKLGIRTVRDVLTHFPRRYLDLTNICTIVYAQSGQMCTISGSIHEVKLKRPRYNLPIVEVTLVDNTGTLIISIFHQPWLKDKLQPGQLVTVAGKVDFNYGFKRMTNPFLEITETAPTEGAILPIHRATEKLSTAALRSIVARALVLTGGMYDPLPVALRKKRDLTSRFSALSAIHFPKEMADVAIARKRLVYEEVLLLQLHLISEGNKRALGASATKHTTTGPALAALEKSLPFTLTADQVRAKDEILHSLASDTVSNHMLLGDVGTGKTIVAAFAFAAAADSSGQALLMAPTEVLAQQHAKVLGALFDTCGIRWALLTGSTKAQERTRIIRDLSTGTLDVLIGTHALLEDDVQPQNLVLAVIDEQQRFGVDQRAKILSKGPAPDALYLTATPIPRSLALALFGNLELSYMKEKPFEQASRKTIVVSKDRRGKAYDAASAAVARGEQVFVVCPFIGVDAKTRDEAAKNKKTSEDENEAYHPSVTIEDAGDFTEGNVAAAATEAKFLQESIFPDYRVGLLHGSLSPDEKARVMEAFHAGEIDVLVTTTVIEVGIDVPNATVMIIEDADRFGLSQLHQLRGRVGRGTLDAHVFLVSSSKTEGALKRLSALEKSNDGFEIAQYDLSLRREGDILGNRQSGASALKLVNIMRDAALIEQAHEDAKQILEEDPELASFDHLALAREVRLLFKDEKPLLGG